MNSVTKSRLPIYAAALFRLALCPMRAEAHLNSTGMGPIYAAGSRLNLNRLDFCFSYTSKVIVHYISKATAPIAEG
jgi:hypothetical protein